MDARLPHKPFSCSGAQVISLGRPANVGSLSARSKAFQMETLQVSSAVLKSGWLIEDLSKAFMALRTQSSAVRMLCIIATFIPLTLSGFAQRATVHSRPRVRGRRLLVRLGWFWRTVPNVGRCQAVSFASDCRSGSLYHASLSRAWRYRGVAVQQSCQALPMAASVSAATYSLVKFGSARMFSTRRTQAVRSPRLPNWPIEPEPIGKVRYFQERPKESMLPP